MAGARRQHSAGRAVAEIGLHDARIARDRLRRALRNDAALGQDEHMFGEAHHGLHDMLDHDDGDAAVANGVDDRHHIADLGGVEAGQHLVQQQQPRLDRQRACQLQALAAGNRQRRGRPVEQLAQSHRARNIAGGGEGIARTFQIVQPFTTLTVRENIAVGSHLSRPARADALAATGEVARAVGLGELLDRPAATLTVAGRKRLELARALAIEPRLLLLDEVLAGLNPSEIRDMVPAVQAICDRGVTIVMIEHVMQAVMSLAEHVLVLSEGRIIAEGPPQAIASDPRVVEAYLGHGAAGRMLAAGAAHA